MHHPLLYIFLPSVDDYNVKLPNFTFCRRREQKTTTFSFFPWTLMQSFRIQLQNNLPTFGNKTKWNKTRFRSRRRRRRRCVNSLILDYIFFNLFSVVHCGKKWYFGIERHNSDQNCVFLEVFHRVFTGCRRYPISYRANVAMSLIWN